jgi:hypothetical protein
MKRRIAILALLAAAPAFAERMEVLPSGHPVAEVEIAGTGSKRFIIDTAASRTAILPRLRSAMPAVAARPADQPLNGASGETKIDLMTLDSLGIAGRASRNVEAVVLPPSPVDALGVDGVLGTDVFGNWVVEMDMVGRRWDIHSQSDPGLVAGLLPPVPMTLDAQLTARIEVRIDGVPIQAVLDTGARGSIMNWAAARALGLTPESPGLAPATPVKGVSQHGTQSFTASFASLRVGEAVVEKPKVRIADLPVFGVLGFGQDEPVMILGIDMLADRRFVVDYPAKQLHISPPASAAAA